ncbi:PREDICTED: band 4.1-like protein 4B, partial [Acropora digitifera]|uniref:band 4.1-like protein 4B n=1 Tax=Acropora digitifera TaxID=70779 RepID=UPI00077AF62A
LQKKAKGQELLDHVFKNLDLVEKDYFGLQFMDTHQVSHWLDPLKKIKKQVRIGPPFTLHFRVRFYAAEPQDLSEELTRKHCNHKKKAKGQELLGHVFKNLDLVEKDYFGLQFMDTHQVSHWLDPLKKIKKQVRISTLSNTITSILDISEQHVNKGILIAIRVTSELNSLLFFWHLPAHLGDFEPELHEPSTDYITEFKFIPNQTKELEREIKKKHQTLVGLNPAECEVNFLRIVKNMDFYGVDMHNVVGENKVECQLGLTPRGIWFIKEKEKKALFSWPRITKMAFKKNRFLLELREIMGFFRRLVKTANKPARTSSFLRFGSRYRFRLVTSFISCTFPSLFSLPL